MSGPSLSSVLELLRAQTFYHPPIPTSDFTGQTVIVTGANTGLGREAAKHISRLNAARLIIACRTVSKGEAARQWIHEGTKAATDIQVWPLDLTSFASVKAFSERAATLDRLDAVLLNAGTWADKYEQAEGHEMTITVNTISTFLLAYLLLPKLQASAVAQHTTARMAVVSSHLHKFATLKARHSDNIFDALKGDPKDYDGRYNDSKLLAVMFVRRLAAETSKSGPYKGRVCLSVMNPGYCVSALRAHETFGERLGQRLMARTTDEGGRLLVDSVVAEKADGRHGQYLGEMRVSCASSWLNTKEGKATEERAWNELKTILEGIAPGCTKIAA